MSKIIEIIEIIAAPASIWGLWDIFRKIFNWITKKRVKSKILSRQTKWAIIVPKYDNNFQRKEDMLAAIKIREWCSNLGVSCTIHDDSDPIDSDTSLFLVCGPKSNQRVRQFYKDFNLALQKENDGSYVISDLMNHTRFISTMRNNKEAEEIDFGILSRRIDSSSGRAFIFCMGIHAHGTLGAACMLTSNKELPTLIPNAKRFESVVSVPHIDDYCSIANLSFALPPRD